MKKVKVFLSKAVATLGLVAQTQIFAQTTDVQYSLDKAPVFSPYSGARITFGELKLTKPTPVVIYLHGCGGLNPNHDVYGWGLHISSMGFLVVLPDSFSRPSRRADCETRTKRTGMFAAAHDYRQQEIDHTVEKLKNLSNVDQRYLFFNGTQ